jgi:hypothetical protein
MEQKKKRSPNLGGARPGAGRPKGSTALITARTLIQAIEQKNKKPFEELLAEGYFNAIEERNNKMRIEYERMFLGKLVADKQEVEIKDSEETVQAKQEAFAQALADLVVATTPKDTK